MSIKAQIKTVEKLGIEMDQVFNDMGAAIKLAFILQYMAAAVVPLEIFIKLIDLFQCHTCQPPSTSPVASQCYRCRSFP